MHREQARTPPSGVNTRHGTGGEKPVSGSGGARPSTAPSHQRPPVPPTPSFTGPLPLDAPPQVPSSVRHHSFPFWGLTLPPGSRGALKAAGSASLLPSRLQVPSHTPGLLVSPPPEEKGANKHKLCHLPTWVRTQMLRAVFMLSRDREKDRSPNTEKPPVRTRNWCHQGQHPPRAAPRPRAQRTRSPRQKRSLNLPFGQDSQQLPPPPTLKQTFKRGQ